MSKILSLKKEYIVYGAVLLLGFLMTAIATQATTTISTNVVTGGTLTVSGASTLASTTATSFQVSQAGTHISRVVTGWCTTASANIGPSTSIGSSTPTFVSCTPSGGSAVISGTGDMVFVQATSSLPSYIIIQSASSTAGNLISVQLSNMSTTTTIVGGVYSFNFFALQ